MLKLYSDSDSRIRPEIPIDSREIGRDVFVPSVEWADWILETFIRQGSLYNPDHKHLEFAHLGVLWTNCANVRQMRGVIGEAEIPLPKGSRWQIARQKYQLSMWFGAVPDFIITLAGDYLGEANDRTLCATIEHELYHCGHALNEYGFPKFHRDGSPVFGIKGHDVEEFIPVAARYGLRSDLKLLLDQANQSPHIGDEVLAGVCGTCRRAAA